MPPESIFASAFFGIASAATWGVGDFCGGYATRRTPVLTVVFLSQLVGFSFLLMLAVISREPLPTVSDLAWGAAAGLFGLMGLASLYQGMSIGQMGIVASVTGVISTALPVAFGALTQGLPAVLRIAGFVIASAGVWLISRSQGGSVRPAGLGLALISGVGFGCFLILIAQAQRNAVFWPLAAARAASVTVMLAFALVRRSVVRPAHRMWPVIAGAGVMDAVGNFLFVLAAQAGRLDVASALASLYPVSTVLLALVLLRERLMRWQVAGVLLSFVAIPLIVAA